MGLWFVRLPQYVVYSRPLHSLAHRASHIVLGLFLLSSVGFLIFLLSFLFQPLLFGFSAFFGFLYIRFLFLICVFHWQICMLFRICSSFPSLFSVPLDFFIVIPLGLSVLILYVPIVYWGIFFALEYFLKFSFCLSVCALRDYALVFL